MDHGGWYAFWVGLFGLLLALVNWLKDYLNTAPKIKSLEAEAELKGHRLVKLEVEHEECMDQVRTEWPSDPGFIMTMARALRDAGQLVTMQDVARLIRFRRKQAAAPDTEHAKPPEENTGT